MKPRDSGALSRNVLSGEWSRSFTFQPQDTQRKPCAQQAPGGVGTRSGAGRPPVVTSSLPRPPPHVASSDLRGDLLIP